MLLEIVRAGPEAVEYRFRLRAFASSMSSELRNVGRTHFEFSRVTSNVLRLTGRYLRPVVVGLLERVDPNEPVPVPRGRRTDHRMQILFRIALKLLVFQY